MATLSKCAEKPFQCDGRNCPLSALLNEGCAGCPGMRGRKQILRHHLTDERSVAWHLIGQCLGDRCPHGIWANLVCDCSRCWYEVYMEDGPCMDCVSLKALQLINVAAHPKYRRQKIE